MHTYINLYVAHYTRCREIAMTSWLFSRSFFSVVKSEGKSGVQRSCYRSSLFTIGSYIEIETYLVGLFPRFQTMAIETHYFTLAYYVYDPTPLPPNDTLCQIHQWQSRASRVYVHGQVLANLFLQISH